MKKIYVAGPYTKGDVAINVRNAFEIAEELSKLGFAPFVPHYTHFWHMLFPHEYKFWLTLDKEFLACCDCLYRIEGDSTGADIEVEHAELLGIPVFYNFDELKKHYTL